MGQGAKEGDWAAGGHTGLSQIGVVFHRFHLPGAKHAKVGGSGGGASHGDGADEQSCGSGREWDWAVRSWRPKPALQTPILLCVL